MVFSLKLKNLIQPTYQSENLVKEFYEPVLEIMDLLNLSFLLISLKKILKKFKKDMFLKIV